MAIPPITPLPVPPTQATPEGQWPDMADAFVTGEYNMVEELNETTIPGINQATQAIDEGVESSGQNATDAAESAVLAGQHKDASQAAAQASASSAGAAADRAQAAVDAAGAAGTSRDQAQTLRNQAGGFRDEAQTFRDQAQALRDETEAIKIGEAINDTSLRPDQARSAQNASIGHFRNVPMFASGAIIPLDFAQITATGASITVTLPVDPLEGTVVMVGNLTVRRDHLVAVGDAKVKGKDVGGLLLIDRAMTTIRLKFINQAYGWDIY